MQRRFINKCSVSIATPSNQVSAGALAIMSLTTAVKYRPVALAVVRHASIQVLITAGWIVVVEPHT
jgi:hypothetical protein